MTKTEIESLLVECFQLPSSQQLDCLHRLCVERPELAQDLRRAFDAVKDIPDLLAPASGEPRLSDSFEILECLGEGGMGAVYLARQTRPVRRDVAIKVVRPALGSQRILARFDTERKILARMSHECIALFYDADCTQDGRPYFVMEHVAGLPLNEYCRVHDLDFEARLRLMIAVCDGVQHAHARGVIHRDIKPSNILVAESDRGPVPKIIDFGLARAMEPRAHEPLTEGGTPLGTYGYMSPEHAFHPEEVDIRADIYSLGATLYRLVAGVTPYALERADASAARWLRALESEVPPPPSSRCRSIPHELDWIVMRALERNPKRRYATAASLAEDLDRFLAHEPLAAGPTTAGYRVRKFARRHRFGVAVALACAVSFFFAGWLVLESRADARRSAAVARFEAGQAALATGSWRSAMRDFAQAEQLGHSALEVRIGRVLALLGLSDDRAVSHEMAALERLHPVGADAARALLIRGALRNRYRSADLGLEEIRLALSLPGLRADEREFGRYFLAESFDEARSRLEAARRLNPHSRMCNVALMTLLLVAGYFEDAKQLSNSLRGTYRDDPIVELPELLDAVLQGDRRRRLAIEARLGSRLQEDMVFAVNLLAFLVRATGSVDDTIVNACYGNGHGRVNVLFNARTAASLIGLMVRIKSANGKFGGRTATTAGSILPPCFVRCLPRFGDYFGVLWRVATRGQSPEDRRLLQVTTEKLAAGTGMGIFHLMLGMLDFDDGRLASAEARLRRAEISGSLIDVQKSTRVALARCCLKRYRATREESYRVAAALRLRRLFRDTGFDGTCLGFLARLAAEAECPDLAVEFARRRVRENPSNGTAKLQLAKLLLGDSHRRRAVTLLDEFLQAQPQHDEARALRRTVR